jgi:hypothetical protein
MKNQNTMTDEQYDELQDQLWELGRDYSLSGILSDIEYPESWTEEDIEEFEDTYEVVDCDPNVEDMTCIVRVESDTFYATAELVVEGNNYYWNITEQGEC